jgi:hypothetical protein
MPLLSCEGEAGAPARVAAIESPRLAITRGSDIEQLASAVATMSTMTSAARHHVRSFNTYVDVFWFIDGSRIVSLHAVSE